MEKNINLAKILNGKPVNTKLWSPLFGDVYTSSICSEDTIIVVNHHAESSSFYNNGKYFDHAEAEPLLFPSKEMRDQGKFAWKKGDLLINSCGFQCIFKEWASGDYTKFNGCYSNSRDGYEDVTNAETAKFDKLDNNIAYGYVREIERKLGGILNLTTLEIEKQYEFKDGDIVCISGMGYLAYGIVKSIDYSSKKLEYYVLNDMSTLKFEDWLSFEDKQIQPITETQQIILFDALAKKNKAWDAEKKMIVDLKPNVDELKPFDKVLVRDNPYGSWEPALFWKKVDAIDLHPYMVIGGKRYRFCEPYEGNEHFLDN